MKTDFCSDISLINLGDKRLNRRFMDILHTMDTAPTCSIPERSINWGQTKATYRFLANKAVSNEAIATAMNASTAARCAPQSTVVIAYDTTNVSFSASAAPGLGYPDHGEGQGLMQHSSFCSDTGGNCLGLLAPYIWPRGRSAPG